MIVHHGGVQGDVSTARLPADAYPALCAYSLNRKLRKLYNGQYFDYIDKDGAGSYPNRTPSLGYTPVIQINNGNNLYVYFAEGHGYTSFTTAAGTAQGMRLDGTDLTVGGTILQHIMDAIDAFGDPKITYVVGEGVHSWSIVPQATFGTQTFSIPEFIPTIITRIYDQKAKDGVPVQDLVQSNQNLAPRLGLSANSAGQVVYKAIFNSNEYMEPAGDLLNSMGQEFTITAVGEGTDVPRPLIGIEGTHSVTLEPSSLTSRFTFDSNIGAITEQATGVTQCRSGYDTEELTYKISVRASNQIGYKSMPTLTASFTKLYVGKHESRLYRGDFSEVTIHPSGLTEIGAEQLFSTTRTEYGY